MEGLIMAGQLILINSDLKYILKYGVSEKKYFNIRDEVVQKWISKS